MWRFEFWSNTAEGFLKVESVVRRKAVVKLPPLPPKKLEALVRMKMPPATPPLLPEGMVLPLSPIKKKAPSEGRMRATTFTIPPGIVVRPLQLIVEAETCVWGVAAEKTVNTIKVRIKTRSSRATRRRKFGL